MTGCQLQKLIKEQLFLTHTHTHTRSELNQSERSSEVSDLSSVANAAVSGGNMKTIFTPLVSHDRHAAVMSEVWYR